MIAESYKLDPGIPPWIVAAMVLGWLVVVAGAVGIFLYRRGARREQRRPPVRVSDPDRPAIGRRTDVEDVEPW